MSVQIIQVNSAACKFCRGRQLSKYCFLGYCNVENKTNYIMTMTFHNCSIKFHAMVYTCALWSPFSTGSCQRYEDKIAQWDEGFAR